MSIQVNVNQAVSTHQQSSKTSHALVRNTALVATPLVLFGADELLSKWVGKNAEKAVHAAIQKSLTDNPVLIQANLKNIELVKSFPSLMGKGSTQVAAAEFSNAMHQAVVQKVNSSVAMTMEQAIGAGSFVGTGNAVKAIEGASTQYTEKMAGSLGKYGHMFVDHLDKPVPHISKSLKGYTASVHLAADINGPAAVMSRSSGQVAAMAEGANKAALQLRQMTPHAKTTIVTPDMAENIATATQEAVTKTSESTLAKTQRLLLGTTAKRVVMGAMFGGLTAWDTYHAVQTTRDPESSTLGKVMAWTTVGLDAIAWGGIVTKNPKVALPAAGLAVGTSIANHFID